ncbi:hypothetical protein [Neobacillus notoginsengisoli]|nr:hypothetical protein [Neobacillus notoginsengisoli]
MIEAKGTDSGGMKRQGGDPMKSGSALVRGDRLKTSRPEGAVCLLDGLA